MNIEYDPFEEETPAPISEPEVAQEVAPEEGGVVTAEEFVELAPDVGAVSYSDYDPFEEIDRDSKRAAEAVTAYDPQKTAQIRDFSREYGLSRVEAERFLTDLQERRKREMAKTVIDQTPGLDSFLNGIPADAPLFQNDLGRLSTVSRLFAEYPTGGQIQVNPYGDAPFDPYGDRRADAVPMDESTGNADLDRQASYMRNGWETLFHGDIERGFDAGVASVRQGALWDRAARGEVDRNSPAFKEENDAYQAELDRATAAGTDGWIYNAAQFAGSAVGSAPEALPAATMGAATAVGAAMIGSVIGAPVALTTAGLIGLSSTLGWFDASSRVEGGLSYKSLIEAGTDEKSALLISRGVGNLNGAIELAFTAVGAKLAEPIFKRFVSRFVPKLGESLSETTLGQQFLQVAKAWGLGTFSETATEVLQESVTMAGEQLAREVADANFDEATLDSTIDRIADTAVNAFKGAMVLGGAGAVVGGAFATAKVRRAQDSKAFFEALSNETAAMETVQTAPDDVHAFIEQQATQETKTTYIDGAQFAQAMIDVGVSREELNQKMPEVAAQIDDAVATGTDVEIPTADYATKIAATNLGRRLIDHVRLAPDALSAADAIQVERAYREAQRAIVRGTFDPAQSQSAERFLESVEGREWAEARKAVEASLFTQIKEAHPEFSDAEVRGQAKLGAIATDLLTRRAGVPVTQMAQWAPTVSATEGTRDSFGQIVGVSGADRLRESGEYPVPYDYVARRMESQGKSPEEIRLATGWEKGADGKWRYEIPDFRMKNGWTTDWNEVEGGVRQKELSDVVDAPELFGAYPRLAKLNVEIGQLPENTAGYYAVDSNTIRLPEDATETPDATLSTLIHEVQHAIQHIEGFATGASTESMEPKDVLLWRDMARLRELRQSEVWKEFDRKLRTTDPWEATEEDQRELEALGSHPDVTAVISEVNRLREVWGYSEPILRAIDSDAWEPFGAIGEEINASDPTFQNRRYRRVAGEVEARNAESRMGMSPEDRRATMLEETESVPRDQQIVRFYQGQNPSVDRSLRGAYSPSQNLITLTPNADLTTFSHELGHWYLANLLELSKLEGTSESLQEDARTILKEFGLGSVEEWDALGTEGQRKFHERFAYWTEIYFATGKAPVSTLQKFFNRLGSWIRDVYRQIRGGTEGALGRAYETEFGEELPQLSDEVRGVLDRMIASEDMLAEATSAESLMPLFDEKPSDMTDEQWLEMRLAREEAEQEGIRRIDEVRAKDMKWMQSARSRELRKIQTEAKEIREKVREQVEIDVNSRPEFVALDIVSRGNRAAVTMNLRMDPEAVAALGYSQTVINKLKVLGCLKKGGLTPQQSAQAIKPFARSLNTGKKLIDAILRAGDKEATIERETTQRCLEKYSDFFDPKKVDAIITKAIYTEARSRLVANELKYMMADQRGRTRVYREAARRVASERLAKMQIGKVSVKGLRAAEARASREAYAAIKAMDRARAIAAKQRQLVCHEMISLALDVEAQVRGLKKIKSQIFAADKKLARTRDVDIVNIARYVMTNAGAGRVSADRMDPTTAESYVEKLRSYDEEKAAQYQVILDRFRYRPGLQWSMLTVEEATDVLETVKALWKQAGEAKTVMVDGKRESMEDIVAGLVGASAKRKTQYKGGTIKRTMPNQKFTKHLLSTKNFLTRVESWCIIMDGGKRGVWHRYIFQPVANAAAQYRAANTEYQRKLADIVDQHPDWTTPTEITYEFGGYTFTTKAELIGAILHTGNYSNKSKLLVGGRGGGHPWCNVWQDAGGRTVFDFSPWDEFFNRCIDEGIITKSDMDAVQAIWDLLEDTKPIAQRAYKRLWGYYFKEVPADEIQTKFGTYRGGYVPAMVDRNLVAEGDTNLAKETLSQTDFLSAMPAHRPGFSQSRVENYRQPLDLNLAMLSGHIQKVLKFAFIAPETQEVAKIISDRDVTDELNRIDPTIIKDLLRPWLKRATEQTLSTGSDSLGWASRSLGTLRSLAGMNIMAGHVVNALQQVTGLSVAAPELGGKRLASAFVQLTRERGNLVGAMVSQSVFMRARLLDRAFEYQSRIERAASGEGLEVKKMEGKLNKIVAIDSKLEPARDWIQRHGYFFQTAMQMPIDTIVWTAAYNKALEEGQTNSDAVAYADSVVRTTQSDFSPENIANIEAGSPVTRLFLVFYNYFGMQANLLGTRWELARQTKDYGRLATDALCIVWIPTVLAGIIQRTLKDGFDTDDDDDVDFADLFQLMVGEPLKGVVAMAPIVGSAINTAGAYAARAGNLPAQLIYGTKPYTGRIMSSPAIDLVGNAGLGVLDIYKIVTDDEKEANARNAARHFLDLATVITRMPLGAIKNPVGFAAGVANDQYEVDNAEQFLEGVMTGKQEE